MRQRISCDRLSLRPLRIMATYVPIADPTSKYKTFLFDSPLRGFTHDISVPQPCAESMYCPEGSGEPDGAGFTQPGFYVRAGGFRLPCPAGSSCPFAGAIEPLLCAPGSFNSQVRRAREGGLPIDCDSHLSISDYD